MVEGESFDETIFNHSVSLKKLRGLLEKEGWQLLRMARLDRLEEALPIPRNRNEWWY